MPFPYRQEATDEEGGDRGIIFSNDLANMWALNNLIWGINIFLKHPIYTQKWW